MFSFSFSWNLSADSSTMMMFLFGLYLLPQALHAPPLSFRCSSWMSSSIPYWSIIWWCFKCISSETGYDLSFLIIFFPSYGFRLHLDFSYAMF